MYKNENKIRNVEYENLNSSENNIGKNNHQNIVF